MRLRGEVPTVEELWGVRCDFEHETEESYFVRQERSVEPTLDEHNQRADAADLGKREGIPECACLNAGKQLRFVDLRCYRHEEQHEDVRLE